jgi:hypothetical protein
MHCLREGRRSLQRWRAPHTTASRLLTVDTKQTLQLPGRRASEPRRSSVLAVDVLHTSSFFGRVLSETGHIELSAQKRDVKMVIPERA